MFLVVGSCVRKFPTDHDISWRKDKDLQQGFYKVGRMGLMMMITLRMGPVVMLVMIFVEQGKVRMTTIFMMAYFL